MPQSLGVCVVALLVVCAFIPERADSQDKPAVIDRTDALRVFLDCGPCDENYLRTEITFINYVRDRKEADVHVLVTTQPTGGGGTEYTLKFIGLLRFAGSRADASVRRSADQHRGRDAPGIRAGVQAGPRALCG
jgi:hypothetical protein